MLVESWMPGTSFSGEAGLPAFESAASVDALVDVTAAAASLPPPMSFSVEAGVSASLASALPFHVGEFK